MIEKELQRLLSPRIDKGDTALIAVDYLLMCDKNAVDVANRFKEVMIALDQALLKEASPEKVYWKDKLPKWFTEQCRPERTEEEKQQYLEWWDQLSAEKKVEEGLKKKKWSLNNWIHWMYPDEREWYWFKSEILSKNSLVLTVLVYGHPYPDGALKWLAYTAGCLEIHLR